ncbi:thioesterase II family protein [Streptomyces spirodelae]|uniref:Thioesterase n=1 Tax=Streptomyces spirodelae TaxID=2812904 RepID=A0ABS3WLJ3_9ACTN|nr:alpha/beta fold hydrolase [Streptomyces spirodelae]MBO8183990.1 thioesterase [Streptomyces spirodelae]
MSPKSWLRGFHTAPEPASRPVQLVCFPHAGGSAGYFVPLSAQLSGVSQVLAVQYPGRQDRWREPAVDNLDELAEQIVAALRPARNGGPLALFGHSMGALVAYEVARRLAPARLYVSGCPAPSRGVEATKGIKDDAGLLADLRRLNGTDAGLLADPEMLELILPALRADYHAVRTYQWQPGSEPRCPVRVLTGSHDTRTPPHVVADWRRHTTGECHFHEYEGGHFYLTEQTGRVADLLAADLAQGVH